jgi:hypothetical protein
LFIKFINNDIIVKITRFTLPLGTSTLDHSVSKSFPSTTIVSTFTSIELLITTNCTLIYRCCRNQGTTAWYNITGPLCNSVYISQVDGVLTSPPSRLIRSIVPCCSIFRLTRWPHSLVVFAPLLLAEYFLLTLSWVRTSSLSDITLSVTSAYTPSLFVFPLV